MDRVDAYLYRLLEQGLTPCEEGEKMFRAHEPSFDFSGFVARSFYSKKNVGNKFLILQWDIGTTEGRGPRGVRTITRFVQGYHAFDNRQTRDSAFLILEDKGLTRGHY